MGFIMRFQVPCYPFAAGDWQEELIDSLIHKKWKNEIEDDKM